jgi:hypothetical protein
MGNVQKLGDLRAKKKEREAVKDATSHAFLLPPIEPDVEEMASFHHFLWPKSVLACDTLHSSIRRMASPRRDRQGEG